MQKVSANGCERLGPHFAAAITVSGQMANNAGVQHGAHFQPPFVIPPGAWVVSDNTVNAVGKVVQQIDCNGVGALRNAADATPQALRAALAALQACQSRYRAVAVYQSAGRYWRFQWYEVAVFMGAAVVLGLVCFWWVRRRLT